MVTKMNEVGLEDSRAWQEDARHEPEEFPAWFENYAEAMPELGRRWREILNDMAATHTMEYREHICLVTSFVLGYRDLTHDISQTMFDQHGGASSPRDFVMTTAMDAVYDLTMREYGNESYKCGEDPQVATIRYATGVALIPNWEAADPPKNAKEIRDLVAIVRNVGIML